MKLFIACVFALLCITASAQERLLIPITGTQTPGAYGSVWTTELWAHNQSDSVIVLRPTFACANLPICSLNTPIEPGSAVRIDLPGVPNGLPPGRILTATDTDGSPAAIDALFVDLRVRDESRATSSMGVEIPIIRHGDLFTKPLSLLNIPGDARYRHTLRIYDLDNKASAFRVKLMAADTGVEIRTQTVALTINEHDFAEGDTTSYAPSAAQLDLRPTIPVSDSRYFLTIEPLQSSMYWAFVSVTNNETQEVTLTTPR